jgi:phosphoribosylanthranilate isomerase
MQPTRHPRLKVCCIQDVEEAHLAVRLGAAALGLVSAMPSGPGVIAEEMIAAIAGIVPPPVASFLLTSRQDVAGIVEQQRRTRVSTLQICDRLQPGAHRELRRALPGIALVQVVHVTGPESVEEAMAVAGEADAILLDSGNQSLAVKELGGTGRRHDWRLSRRIRESVPVPIFLAGGLRSENVQEAIAEVGPFALDVCSGVRTDGRLDPQKLERFVAAIAAG